MLNVDIAAKLHAHVAALGLERDDLLSTTPKSSRPALKLLAHPERSRPDGQPEW